MAKIMIADDDFAIGMEIEEMLTALGYDVVGQAGSGQEAVKMAQDLKPDLILMDVVMPGEMNGIEAAEKIKAESDIPIVFISGYGDPEYIEMAKQIEPFGYVMKPFDEKEVRAFIEIALHKRQMELKLKKAHERLEKTNRELNQEVMERKEIETALRESEERYMALFDRSLDCVYIHDFEGNFLDANPATLSLFGYKKEEIPSLNFASLLDEGQIPLALKTLEELKATGRQKGLTEFKLMSKNGETLYMETTASVIYRDGKPYAIEGIARNVTERKRAAEKLRFVSSMLLDAQERERKRISLELHDELGQSLLALKLQLSSIEKRLEEGQTELRSDCQTMLGHIVGFIGHIRRICKDLSPVILDDLGLTAGIRLLAENALESHDIHTSLDIANIDKLLTNEQQLGVFRVFQGAFTNIVKHSCASFTSIVIKKQDGKISFVIEDNGKGFDVKEAMGRDFTKRGMGLAAMEERAWMLGGSINIWSQRKLGTRIEFRVPTE